MPLLIIVSLNNSAPDPDPLDSQDFGVLDPDLQKYAYPRIQIQGAKYHPKTVKKMFIVKPQIWTIEKERL